MLRLNEDEEQVKLVREALEQNDGHCPCAIEHNDDTKCMCKDFRDKMKDVNFKGYCHCGLYYFENV